jgi:hypothetical protein
VKSALIDRAVVQFVRTLGSKTHDDQEFEKNLMNPEVKCKMRAFRILTCLMGMLKLLIFRCVLALQLRPCPIGTANLCDVPCTDCSLCFLYTQTAVSQTGPRAGAEAL